VFGVAFDQSKTIVGMAGIDGRGMGLVGNPHLLPSRLPPVRRWRSGPL